MKVAIHQPNFIPWIGLFDKINAVNKFIVFDHVQATRGKSWLNRNKIVFKNELRWLSIPIRKKNYQLIKDVEINYDSDFIKSHLGIIKQEYYKTPNFSYFFDFFSELYNKKHKYIKDLNMSIIRFFCDELRIETEFILSSDIIDKNKYIQNLSGNDLVLELCKIVGSTTYLSGTGCKDFILPNTFKKQNIKFIFQKTNFNEYSSENGEQLSILDHSFRKGLSKIEEDLRFNKLGLI